METQIDFRDTSIIDILASRNRRKFGKKSTQRRDFCSKEDKCSLEWEKMHFRALSSSQGCSIALCLQTKPVLVPESPSQGLEAQFSPKNTSKRLKQDQWKQVRSTILYQDIVPQQSCQFFMRNFASMDKYYFPRQVAIPRTRYLKCLSFFYG